MDELVSLRITRAQPRGLAVWRAGFRPFFWLAALHAVLSLPLWVWAFRSGDAFPTQWHASEMTFGFTGAVLAGFLTTAVPKWTKRRPQVGRGLILLAVPWLIARVCHVVPALHALGVVFDLTFAVIVVAEGAGPIWSTRNGRNYGVLAAIVFFAAGAAIEALALRFAALQGRGTELALFAALTLVALISGRVAPIFSKNAFERLGLAVRVEPRVWLGRFAVAFMAFALLLEWAEPWLLSGDARLVGAVLRPVWLTSVGGAATAAGVLFFARSARWGFFSTLRHPLLWVMHVGHAWLAAGVLVLGIGRLQLAFGAVPTVGYALALHALTSGGLGLLALGIMARASLGHTGRPLQASGTTTAAFLCLLAAASLRVLGALVLSASLALALAAVLWFAAFGLFLVEYTGMLFRPRPDGMAG